MVTADKDGISHQFACKELNYDRHFNDVLQLIDVSPDIVVFYRNLKALIDANQTHLGQSASFLELLDKSHKLQKAHSHGKACRSKLPKKVGKQSSELRMTFRQ